MPTLTPRDIFKPDVLTGLIKLRETDETTGYDITDLAPIKATKRTRVQMNLRTGNASRLGQFRADNAFTPITAPLGQTFRNIEIEIPLLSEKTIVREDILRRLNSVDLDIAQEAVDDIVDSTTRLREQNTNLSKWMVWRACMDALTITYPNGVGIDIDYGLENGDAGMSGSHLPSAGTVWSNIAAPMVANIDAWAGLIAEDQGASQDQITMWTSTRIWRYIQANTEIQTLVGTADLPVRPTRPEQVAEIFGLSAIKLYDGSYKDAANVTQKFFPDTKVLLKGPNAGSQPIVQLFDGPVTLYNASSQSLSTSNNPGMRVETWASPDPPVQNVRLTTARMPMIIREGLVCATVL